MEPSEHIRGLREVVLAPLEIRSEECELLWGRAWLESAGEPWNIIRRGQATAAVLRGLSAELGEHELLVGRFPTRKLTEAERAELEHWRKDASRATSPVWGQRAHMAIDYPVLLRLGLAGVRDLITTYRARLNVALPDDMEKDAFYRACLLALDGVRDLAFKYADVAEARATQCEDVARAAELREIAAVCRRVPEQPAETFREAVQAVHFLTWCLCAGQLMLLFQLGRPDRYLLPYYRRDITAGRLTSAQAQDLVDHLCLMLSVYTPRGLAVGFMIGGRDGSGRDISNELTRHFLESIAHTRLPYPGIGLCWNSDTPEDITERACELVAQGLTHPAFFNDERITAGFMAAGLPPAEACEYQHSTCVELTPVASSNVYVASPYINLLQLLHDLIGIQPVSVPEQRKSAGPGGQFGSFAELQEAYELHLNEVIRNAAIEQNTCMMTRYYHGGWPLLSCFVHDCLAKGVDIDRGGARHNWIEPSFVGLSNLVDALTAIRRYVFEEHTLTLPELARDLALNYEGHEDLRLRLLHQAPKYGNDDDTVDELAVWMTDCIVRATRKYRTFLGGAFHPGFFCWIMHERLGRETAASPDGRLAEMALGDGSGPAQGRERRGPTAAVLSATKWDHTPMLGGIAVNLKFTRSGQKATFVQGLRRLIETFMQRGGFETQVNVVDRETLLAAQKHPEQYRDLTVRIGGYSDYFVGLSPRMQEELILRTEHESL
ncbi:MAG: hypothetical protein GX557_08490 [Chloroflexi bacterium]|nr:hypothetical protein [Chloroflexota bacterium]